MSKKTEYKYTFHLFPMDWRLLFRVVAVMISWYFNKSIGWAVLHYIFGWMYVLYVLLTGGFADGNLGEIIRHYFD